MCSSNANLSVRSWSLLHCQKRGNGFSYYQKESSVYSLNKTIYMHTARFVGCTGTSVNFIFFCISDHSVNNPALMSKLTKLATSRLPRCNCVHQPCFQEMSQPSKGETNNQLPSLNSPSRSSSHDHPTELCACSFLNSPSIVERWNIMRLVTEVNCNLTASSNKVTTVQDTIRNL